MGGRRAAVAVVGSCNMDFAVFADRLPAAGETVTGRSLLTAPGGKGANQAIAAARAGGQVRMIGAVGDDAAGAQVRACLDRAGADVTALRTVPEPTGSAHITVDAAGTNSIVVIPGANASVTELTAADRAVIAASDVLLLQLELPVAVVTASAAAAGGPAGPLVVLTPAPARPLPRQLLDLVGLLVANEHEARQLAGGGDALAALLALVPAAVITLGAAGCRYGRRDGTRISVPAPAVAAVDTTAAGDTFTGALAVALAEGRPAAAALRWATSAAALCVQQPGAAGSMPGRAEIDALARTLTVPGQHREPAPGA
ncbi:MAG: ribokinase [Streptosporangiaceae bacterium]